ncbi:MAG: hydrogenase maturation nickel metallochaperone HypA [Acidobacteria bacterium]|nr:hydrogenase maturation nickel metallochaperone HypA [Acidobacteriota bacterium]
MARQAPDQKISEVGVEVGVLSGVVVHALQYGFGVAKLGTLLEEATLTVATGLRQAECANCKTEFQSDQAWSCCPQCQSDRVKFRGGDDVRLLFIEVVE